MKVMAADENMAILRAAFDSQRSLVGNSNLTEQSFKGCQKAIKSLFMDIIDLVQPWNAKGEDRKVGEINDLISAYKTMVGDPDDPEFQRKLLKDAEENEKRNSVAVVETDEQRVDRLLLERSNLLNRR